LERSKHGLGIASWGVCGRGEVRICLWPGNKTSAGGVSEVYRGFAIYFMPPPEREWSFRPAAGAALQSF
jgi:hypothetical protein